MNSNNRTAEMRFGFKKNNNAHHTYRCQGHFWRRKTAQGRWNVAAFETPSLDPPHHLLRSERTPATERASLLHPPPSLTALLAVISPVPFITSTSSLRIEKSFHVSHPGTHHRTSLTWYERLQISKSPCHERLHIGKLSVTHFALVTMARMTSELRRWHSL